MKIGWKEMARLGTEGLRYPHILVDPYGWCLRLGPDPRRDDKYFSGLLSLLQGLSEHLIRRRDYTCPGIQEVEALRLELRQAMASASVMASRSLECIESKLNQVQLAQGGDILMGETCPGPKNDLNRILCTGTD